MSEQGENANAEAPHKPEKKRIALALLALAPAALVYMVMSGRTNAREQALIAGFQESLSRVEQNISQLNAQQVDTQAILQSTPTPTALSVLSEGNIQFNKGDIDSAIRNYRVAIAMDQNGAIGDEAHYKIAQCMMEKNSIDDGLQEYLTVVRLHPGGAYFGRACIGAADILIKRGNYSQARRFLYMVLGARDRLTGDDRLALEEACYALPECYDMEAAAIEGNRVVAAKTFGFNLVDGIQ